MKVLLRVVGYLAGAAILAYVAFLAGVEYYDRTKCAGADNTDCLGALGGFFWGVGVVALCVVAAVVIEIVLWRRRSSTGSAES
ncbi:hypothetical protein E1263_13320 [Kribbella antibiotica]|uniref:Uncharacterized protein n=1 Tax=Kribbella antibiotica TaxID=190195 RepID=A0A4R4ZMT4_9ACTN|nr:hypothetical protein [Kribbella antibiotica]TDD59905.1 hypothetical protein E1263_13320 [Kribbella antibiotica]